MPTRTPLALLLLLLQLGALLLAAHASPVPAGNRIGIVRASSSVTSMAWQRRLEDEVAPEFPIGGLLRGEINYGPGLDPDRPACQQNKGCAAKCNGCSYTRPCTYKEKCPQGHD